MTPLEKFRDEQRCKVIGNPFETYASPAEGFVMVIRVTEAHDFIRALNDAAEATVAELRDELARTKAEARGRITSLEAQIATAAIKPGPTYDARIADLEKHLRIARGLKRQAIEDCERAQYDAAQALKAAADERHEVERRIAGLIALNKRLNADAELSIIERNAERIHRDEAEKRAIVLEQTLDRERRSRNALQSSMCDVMILALDQAIGGSS